MEQIDKRCGNCAYYNYKGERGLKTAVCEVYTAQHYHTDKPCHNWKEENVWRR